MSRRTHHAHAEEFAGAGRPRPQLVTEDLPLFSAAVEERVARDRVLETHEERHARLLTVLRTHARSIYDREHRPVSVNDVRHILAESEFAGDKRLLGQVFAGKAWRRVGVVMTDCEGATIARVGASRASIGCYVPAEGSP